MLVYGQKAIDRDKLRYYRPEMDLLSVALSRMRLSSSMLARYDATVPWSVNVIDGKAITAYFVLKGTCWFCPTGDQPNTYLREGDLLMLPRWCEHQLCSSPDVAAVPIIDVARQSGTELWDSTRPLAGVVVLKHRADMAAPPDAQLLAMMFKADEVYQQDLLNCLPPTFHLAAEAVDFTALIAMIRQFVALQIEKRPDGYAAAGHRMAELLLIELLRTVAVKRPAGTTGWLNGLATPSIASAMAALHRDPQRRWTLEALARTAGLSRSQFSAKFARIVGQSVMTYVQGVRLQWAAERLLRDAPIKEVSAALDYATPFGFHKAFMRQFGISPGEWRKLNRQDSRSTAYRG